MNRKGDKGITETKNNQILCKDNPFIEFLGQLDSLNSIVGWANVIGKIEILLKFQKSLLKIGGYIEDIDVISQFLIEETHKFDKYIIELYLPVIHNFVIPSNDELATRLHIVRTKIRKVERMAVLLKLPEFLIMYLNRSSTLLFALARKAMLDTNQEEILWKND